MKIIRTTDGSRPLALLRGDGTLAPISNTQREFYLSVGVPESKISAADYDKHK